MKTPFKSIAGTAAGPRAHSKSPRQRRQPFEAFSFSSARGDRLLPVCGVTPRHLDLIPYVSTREARQLIREALHFDATRLQEFRLSPNARRWRTSTRLRPTPDHAFKPGWHRARSVAPEARESRIRSLARTPECRSAPQSSAWSRRVKRRSLSAGGPNCSSIGVPKAQEALRASQVPPVAGATPIDMLSVPPAGATAGLTKA
jgi:hypothetical protein